MWRPIDIPDCKIWFLDKYGWPVETIKGRPITNFIRLLLHTRKITTTWKVKNVPWVKGTVTWSADEIAEASNRAWERTQHEGLYMPMPEDFRGGGQVQTGPRMPEDALDQATQNMNMGGAASV